MESDPLLMHDIPDWYPDTLRVTVFLSPAQEFDQGSWWAEVTGSLPETRTEKPIAREHKDEGEFGSGTLVLSVRPNRIDWLLTVRRDPEKENEDDAGLGPLPESMDDFATPMGAWLEASCPATQRLAFGAVLLRRVETREDGYRRLATYLPSVRLDIEGMSDFFYQINRPRNATSIVNELKMNRLSKWSVAVTTLERFGIAADGVEKISRSEPQMSCRLELDISTAAEFTGQFSQEQLKSIFQELLDLGKEIVAEGDIP